MIRAGLKEAAAKPETVLLEHERGLVRERGGLAAIVNLILGPVFRLLSLPLIVVTLGLFLLVVNAALLAITAAVSSHLTVDNFGSAVLGGFLIAVFSWLAELLLPVVQRGKHAHRARAVHDSA